ncbi:LLM class flavin-dependent oxidoreductase [Ilumatobacter sp.]|uniref:LLM class flavin-dependent oxidoreductase n=1 Tax=Ilumatobacter sp. TaxID=1967498 RepID=UPI003C5CA809
MGSDLGFGLVLPLLEQPVDGSTPRWTEIVALATQAEAIGLDTVWTADEIVWRFPEWSGPRGWWECLAMTGAVAARTSSIQVGTWVLSALQRNPAMIANAAETLDEISGGRFVLGLGAGHDGGGAAEFGYPGGRTVSRYAESLEIVVPMLRGETVTFEGEFHRAQGAEVVPQGPRPGQVPLMLGGHAPRTMTLSATHADIWSAFATTSSLPSAFEPLTHQLDQICESIGRDPATIGRSVGVFVEPGDADVAESIGFGVAITGSNDQIIETLAEFSSVGVTRVEIVPYPNTMATLERLAPALSALI